MKSTILLVALISVYFNVWAQIPIANQQPKWCMGVYMEDALGMKDTVYVGEDPTAQQGNTNNPFNDDTIFGEKWIIPSNPNGFRASTYHWILPSDSALKVDINNYNISNNLYFSVLFDSVTLPIIIKWDLNKLYSDSLPFIDQGNLPRAQIEFDYPSGQLYFSYPPVSCDPNLPIIISDTIQQACVCCSKDSIVLADAFSNTSKQVAGMNFYIRPWSGLTPLSLNEYNNSDFKIFPNPFSDKIYIKTKASDLFFKIELYSFYGKLLSTKENCNDEFDISEFTPGIYFLKFLNLKTNKLTLMKIIKS